MSSRGWEGVTAASLKQARQGVQRPAGATTAVSVATSRRSKYHAVRTTVDGITFDSKKEAARYAELKLRLKAGHIRNLSVQPKFRLLVEDRTVAAMLRRIAGRLRGQRDPVPDVVVGYYVGDFQYYELGLPTSENDHWSLVIEDVKGFKTPLYRWKKKHFEAQYGILIREI